jgi:hypothetical protein
MRNCVNSPGGTAWVEQKPCTELGTSDRTWANPAAVWAPAARVDNPRLSPRTETARTVAACTIGMPFRAFWWSWMYSGQRRL